MPVQNTNLSEKTPLIYPADSPGGSLPVHDENDQDAFDASNALLADGVVSKTVDLDSLPDVTENWTFINRLFYIAYFPFSIWFIMVNEALERFSFYGLRGKNQQKAKVKRKCVGQLLWRSDLIH